MFGRLTLKAFEHDFVQNTAVFGMIFGGIAVAVLLTYFKKWKWLWEDYIKTVDHKKIGIMYFIVALILFLRGFGDALLMRVQQALSVGDSHGYLEAGHFQEIFSAHGTTMIFFVGMGIVFGLMNCIVPLQIGARDVAFPFMNAVSFWLFAAAGALLMVSLAIGHFSAAGWLAYPPLSSPEYSTNEGVDYWIWIVQLAGVGSTLAGINFLVTILKMRCKGMTLMRMPIFVWSALCCMILVVFAFPILTATLYLLTLDRYAGMHFFSASYGGNFMMYVNLIWAWGHPEVYILILPLFGVFSEVVSTFSEKRLFGYVSMIWALVAITILSFIVWLHHFFTMGASVKVNAFFAIMTMLIAIPTGVKIFNWLFTKFRGRVHFTTPMLWFFAFVLNFSVGGMTGILLSAPPVDYQVHNSLFLIAHFHGMVIGGVVFGFFSGFTYWFPKVTGFYLNERISFAAFWFWFSGFLLAFMPLYMLGFMGATRRLDHYDTSTGWHPLFQLACAGAILIFIGIMLQVYDIFYSIIHRKKQADTTGDPWNGRSLEWSIPSPAPIYNFAIPPMVDQIDPLWAIKRGEAPKNPAHYHDIILPINTAVSPYIGFLALTFAFCMVWYIYWLAIASFVGIVALLVIRLSEKEKMQVITAEEVRKTELQFGKQRV
jgi:cytochrome o ubiquinol oxidase subunit 1